MFSLKKVFISFFGILIFFFLISTYVGAHSYLQQSYPSHGEVIENSVQDISLTFDAGIESSSVIEIFRSNGEEVPLQELIVDSPYIEVTLVDPLPTDDYKLNWLVIGDDGHPTEGTIEFSVILPEIDEEVAGEEVTEQEEANELGEEVVEERETDEGRNDELTEGKTITEKNSGQSLNMLLIGILFIAIIVVLFVVSKRKR